MGCSKKWLGMAGLGSGFVAPSIGGVRQSGLRDNGYSVVAPEGNPACQQSYASAAHDE